MACLKLGTKKDGFQRKGQSWFYTTGLLSDIVLEVEQVSFHLHKFPLVSRSGRLAKIIENASDEGNKICCIQLHDIPGGAYAFELAVKFCYGVKMELTASNVVILCCAAEYLEMTEVFNEENLISKTRAFLAQLVFRHWKESIVALRSCESVLSYAEKLGIVTRCLDSIAMKAGTDPDLFGWPIAGYGSMQSPGGSLLWNGISTGQKPKKIRSDWWYEDITVLSLPVYERLMASMEARGIKPENIAGALIYFTKRHLPILSRCTFTQDRDACLGSISLVSVHSKGDQKVVLEATDENQKAILETIERLLPTQKGVVPTQFLSGLFQSAMLLDASAECKSNLERRIGMQLDLASLEDLLFPNISYNMETQFDIDCVHRILDHFLLLDQSAGEAASPHSADETQLVNSPTLTPMSAVARIMDSYLAEVAPDVNLKPSKFQLLAESLPSFSRTMDDGLYRAIDIYIKAHPWLTENERDELCRIINWQTLSLEACTHAAQNECLPIRVVMQVLFFEQLRLRTAIASCLMISDNLDTSCSLGYQSVTGGPLLPSLGEGWSDPIHENQVLKVNVGNLRLRVRELEKECSNIRQGIERLGKVMGSSQVISQNLEERI